MGKTFSAVSKVAVEEIMKKHLRDSKFGYFISQEGFYECIDDLIDLLETSRNLKSAGDRFLQRKEGPTKSVPPGPQKKRPNLT